ncbi:MAG: hypothetical protein ABJB69_04590 [Spartobacteria bacterium]
MKIRANRRKRHVELQILARKIIVQLRARGLEMSMFARDHIGLQPPPQDRQFTFHRAPVDELEQT